MTGPDSRDAERAVTLAFANVSKLPEWMQVPALGRDMTPLGELAAAALRAAGLLPGPDTITVNREDLRNALGYGRAFFGTGVGRVARDRLLAALPGPPAPKEQQPPPFDPDLKLMANREGNRREVRAYRRDAAPSDVQEQP